MYFLNKILIEKYIVIKMNLDLSLMTYLLRETLIKGLTSKKNKIRIAKVI